jgi:hypothetical protein
MIRAIKKLALKYFSPYTIEFYDPLWGDTTQVLHAWTWQDAMEWTACSLREESVEVWCVNSPFTKKLVAVRSPMNFSK